MAVYLTHRDLPGITLKQLEELQKLAVETSARFTLEGMPIRFIRTSWVPSESQLLCFFEADNPRVVRDVNEDAGIPFTRIVEVMEVTPG